ncbi:MAG: hypothetical protein K2H64_03580, partial [Desulfovibrio sp.]|nr:hypothetical protein [Desulfovibrio sp.]
MPEDDLTRAYMDAHEQEIFHAYRDANPSMSKEEAREAARLAAIKFDTWARGRAYDEHVNVKDYYDNWKPKWESYRNFEPADWREAVPAEWRNPNSKLGDALEDLSYLRGYEGLSELNANAVGLHRFLEQLDDWEAKFPDLYDYASVREGIAVRQVKGLSRGETLNHAMYRSAAENIESFLETIRKSGYQEKSFFNFNPITRDGVTLPVELGFNQMRHIDKRHPDFKRWDEIPNVVEAGNELFVGYDFYTRSPAYLYTLELSNNTSHAVIAADVKGNPKKGKPHRKVVLTSFVGNTRVINKWKQKYKDAVSPSSDNQTPPSERGSRSSLPSRDGSLDPQDSVNSAFIKSLNDEVNEILTPAPRKLRHSDPVSIPLPGRESQLIGPSFREPVRYEVRELADVLPSHDPERNFQRTENYPKLAQERPYDKDLGEKEKVIANATNFEPAFLLSDDPGATNGPPIVTRDGIVLGGNSRTMSLKLVYAKNTE